MNKALIILSVLFLAACADTPVPPSKLTRPAAALMVAPEALPDIVPGDDLALHGLKVRTQYGKETAKLVRLQRYVRAVTK